MYKDENSYNLNSALTNVDQISRATERINDAFGGFDRYEELSNTSYDALDSVIYEAEKIALSCRRSLENISKTDKDYENFGPIFPQKDDEILSTFDQNTALFYNGKYPVNIEFTNGILKISTPLTFKRFYRKGNLKENYVLMVYVRNALIRWQKENYFDLYRSIETPMVLSIVRKTPNKKISGICDCDNMENNRIANEILDALGNTDNALVLSVFSTLVVTNDPDDYGMEFILCSKADFPSVFDRF